MFAALTLCRLREESANFTFTAANAPNETNTTPSILATRAWQTPDTVPAIELPLAKATEKVLASMHAVLVKTSEQRTKTLHEPGPGVDDAKDDDENMPSEQKQARHLNRTKASEVRIPSFVEELKHPPTLDGVTFQTEEVDMKEKQAGDGQS